MQFVSFVHRPTWYFRSYVQGGSERKRGYIKRLLKATDRREPELSEFDEWRKPKTLHEAGGSLPTKYLHKLMDDRIEKSWQRVVTGEIKGVTQKSKPFFFTKALKNFFKAKGYNRITGL